MSDEFHVIQQIPDIVSYCDEEGERWLRETSGLHASEGMTVFSDRLLKPFVRQPQKKKSKALVKRTPLSPIVKKAMEQMAQVGSMIENQHLNHVAEGLRRVFPFRRYWTAKVDGKTVGRIALFARIQQEAFFGFFYVQEGFPHAGLRLLEVAAETARRLGFRQMRGPFSLHPMLGAGILTGGTGSKPVLYQPHNRETRRALSWFYLHSGENVKIHEGETWGWRDSYRIPVLLEKLSLSTKAHKGLVFREFNPQDDNDIESLVTVYNDASQDDPGFIPLTIFEAKWALRDTIIVEQRCSLMAELNGEPIAAIITAKNQKPIDTMKADEMVEELPRLLFLNLLGRKVCLRVLTFGVRRKFRGAAVGAMATTLWYEMLERALDCGYEHIITPVIDVTDSYRMNASKLLMLRPERRVVQYVTHFNN